LIEATIKNLKDINTDSDKINDLIDSAKCFVANLGIDSESDFKFHRCINENSPTWLDQNAGTQVTFRTFYKK